MNKKIISGVAALLGVSSVILTQNQATKPASLGDYERLSNRVSDDGTLILQDSTGKTVGFAVLSEQEGKLHVSIEGLSAETVILTTSARACSDNIETFTRKS